MNNLAKIQSVDYTLLANIYHNTTFVQDNNPTSFQQNLDNIIASLNPLLYLYASNKSSNRSDYYIALVDITMSKIIKTPDTNNITNYNNTNTTTIITKSTINNTSDQLNNLINTNIIDNIKNGKDYNINTNTNNIKVQVYDSDNTDKIKQISINTNSTYLDVSKCESKIRQELGLSKKDKLPIKMIQLATIDGTDLQVKLVDDSNINIYQIYYGMFNPKTGEELDIKKLCAGLDISVFIPLDSSLIDKETYIKYKARNINIYDSNDPFFKDVCYTYVDPTSGIELPINLRTTDLKNEIKTVGIEFSCGSGCTFAGMDEVSFYAQCSCVNVIDTNPTITKSVYNQILFSNLNIIICYNVVFNSVYDLY